MDLTTDAQGILPASYDVAEDILNKQILSAIEEDLDLDEKVSILFLMVKDYETAFDIALDMYKNQVQSKENPMLEEIVTSYGKQWKDALLEAFCIIQNKQIIRKLGVCYSELEPLYIPKNRLCSKHFHSAIKCLYMMCESLTECQIRELIMSVKSNMPEYDKNLEDTYILELHLLYWMKKGYISVSNGRAYLKNLLKYLKGFDDLELIYTDLKKCEDRQNVLDTYNTSTLNGNMPQSFSSSNDNHYMTYSKGEGLRQVQKGLCIIISQLFFVGQKYETRFGTAADCSKLRETFNGFGFDVFICENLKKHELLEKLGNISKEFGTDYDCIFVCILSHGCKGTIITCDEEEVPIEALEHKICCPELTDVIKILVIQACQGKLTGKMDSVETTDGPNASNVANIASYRNFCLFMSTIQGFVSVRHKLEGSWFIQEFCNILQNGGGDLTFYKVVGKVMQSVEKKRGKVDGTDAVAQLPELRSCRLLSDFQFPKYHVE